MATRDFSFCDKLAAENKEFIAFIGKHCWTFNHQCPLYNVYNSSLFVLLLLVSSSASLPVKIVKFQLFIVSLPNNKGISLSTTSKDNLNVSLAIKIGACTLKNDVKTLLPTTKSISVCAIICL